MSKRIIKANRNKESRGAPRAESESKNSENKTIDSDDIDSDFGGADSDFEGAKSQNSSNKIEHFKHPLLEDAEFDGGLRIPGDIYRKLFKFQRTGVKWMWELHCQNVGGIIADEMGLGKTVQVVAFLAGLRHSGKAGPTLILCPASVMIQWLREFRFWAPEFRVMLLHESGNHASSRRDILKKFFTIPKAEGPVLISTYDTLYRFEEFVVHKEFGYAFLDEGHKIRNPDAGITQVCKQLLCLHRIILSGAPIQNSLKELWSLFDFIFPGKLGTLPVFEEEFCVPLRLGGYVGASVQQVQMAHKCATVLRDIIGPYILRRMKKDVKGQFKTTKKTEHVLFCNLTESQIREYRDVLNSREVRELLVGRGSVFRAISFLRKLCNHADLYLYPKGSERPPDYGSVKRSGKLLVLRTILKMWHRQKHRCLIFCQTKQMLDIVELFVKSRSYTYCRLDGDTSIRIRQPMIEEFNRNDSVFCFLLTSRAGGLGVNLIGADRVLLVDPDWNPSTDIQARERSFRIGQLRDVTVYRLVSRGTIEEKVYQRQIFKHFLTDKVLKDSKQKRFFSQNDLRDLFILDVDNEAETANIFAEVAGEITPNDVGSRDEKKKKKETGRTNSSRPAGSDLARVRRDVRRQLQWQNDREDRAKKLKQWRRERTNTERTNTERANTERTNMERTNTERTNVEGTSVERTNTERTNTERANTERTNMERTNTERTNVEGTSVERTNRERTNSVERPNGVLSEEMNGTKRVRGRRDESDNGDNRRVKKRMKQESGNSGKSPSKSTQHVEQKGEDHLLKILFNGSSVSTVMSHDKIVGGRSELVRMESQASKMADKAIKALRQSQRSMEGMPLGVPTWTGRSGAAGAASSLPPRFGRISSVQRPSSAPPTSDSERARPFNSSVAGLRRVGAGGAPMSSAALLKRIRERRKAAQHSNRSPSPTSVPSDPNANIDHSTSSTQAGQSGSPGVSHDRTGAQAESLGRTALALRRILRKHSGGLKSEVLIEMFAEELRGDHDRYTFRQLLRQMCTFKRGRQGQEKSLWVLKEKYR
eukprot:378268_1